MKKTLLLSALLFTMVLVTGCNSKNDINNSYAYINIEKDSFNILKLQVNGKKVSGVVITHSANPSSDSKTLSEDKKVVSGSLDGENILFIGDIFSTGFFKNEDLIIKDSTGKKLFNFQKASEEEMNMKLDVFKKSHLEKDDEISNIVENEEDTDETSNIENNINDNESNNFPVYDVNDEPNSEEIGTLLEQLNIDISNYDMNLRIYRESRVLIITTSERVLNDIAHFNDDPNNSYTNTCVSKPESKFVKYCEIVSGSLMLSDLIQQANKQITDVQANYDFYNNKLNTLKKIIKETDKTNDNYIDLTLLNAQAFDSDLEIKQNAQLLIKIENESEKIRSKSENK